ncbi:hypothetical protein GCM10025868_07960 [Angustibacter aerolatus]|uniref:Uncharacterized protein n=1 Tax=Angustibacter aerolatus TaxID=1162965 RepID=A0ABQ6JDA1_9ACTN|nr:hypothetical protein GCM10025868_07960 [Angustibacter aerolatus]
MTAFTTPTIFWGRRTTTPATCQIWLPMTPGTEATGCRTRPGSEETPRNPTDSSTGFPSRVSGVPSSDSTCRWVDGTVADSVSRSPSRSTTTGTVRPPDARIAARASSQVPTGRPAIETMRSPARMPAAAAGAGGSLGVHFRDAGAVAGRMHSLTVPTLVVRSIAPRPARVMVNSTTAMSRLTNGPPSMTTTFLRTGNR